MTIVVIAIALALPACLRVAMNNAEILSGSWEGAIDFTVYLNLDVSDERAEALSREVLARDDVINAVLVTQSQALEEFRDYSGFGDALDALDENPLPHSLVVRPAHAGSDEVGILAAALREFPETALVQVDTAWVERLSAILTLIRRIVDIATILLGLAVVLIIGNTIRLEINSLREEIQVVKLVGGSDGFIRRPFLYMGFVFGLLGAALAALTVTLSVSLVTAPSQSLALLYGSNLSLSGLTWQQTLTLLASGCLLGWAGAGIAAARHLRTIEPS